MSFIKGAGLRRLFPYAVGFTTVIALAALPPLATEASRVNNCGVKGGFTYAGYAYAFHDHGKPCPNRPFPGKGEGIEDKLVTGAVTTSTAAPEENGTESESETNSSTLSLENNGATAGTQSKGHGHGHSKGHGHGKGND